MLITSELEDIDVASNLRFNLLRFVSQDKGSTRLGLLRSNVQIQDVTATLDAITGRDSCQRCARIETSDPMISLIRATSDEKRTFTQAVTSAAPEEAPVHHRNDVKLLAPFVPRNIYCVGLNYAAHREEFTRSGTGSRSDSDNSEIILFMKSTNSVVGPADEIVLSDSVAASVDYEAEVGVVIGKTGRNIPTDKAWEYVFGVTGVNDITARDVQSRQHQWFVSKSFDGFCPIGPTVLTTGDELAGPCGTLRVESFVNGEKRQDGQTSDMIRDIPEIIAELSNSHTLVPGDIIATGTPAGVGLGFDVPRFLNNGDTVEVRIEGVGTLTNSFIVGP